MGRYSLRDGKITADGDLEANKLTVSGKMPVQYIIPKTVAVSTSAILTDHDFNATGTAAVDNTGILVQPPYPMELHLNWNAVGTASDDDGLVFVGENAMGKAITDTLLISSAASGNVYTSNAYAKIDSITPNTTIKCTSVGLGFRNVVGLPYPLEANTDIISYAYDGAYATTAVDALTVDTTYNNLTLPAMEASKVISVQYLSKVQE